MFLDEEQESEYSPVSREMLMLNVEVVVTIWSLNHREDGNWFHESDVALLESGRLSMPWSSGDI